MFNACWFCDNSMNCWMLLTDPLQDKCAPDSVKYRVRHLRNNLHLPFFSFNWPSIIGWLLPRRKPTALSGWLHKKHPHWYSSSFAFGLLWSVLITSNTSKKPEWRSSFTRISWSYKEILVNLVSWYRYHSAYALNKIKLMLGIYIETKLLK